MNRVGSPGAEPGATGVSSEAGATEVPAYPGIACAAASGTWAPLPGHALGRIRPVTHRAYVHPCSKGLCPCWGEGVCACTHTCMGSRCLHSMSNPSNTSRVSLRPPPKCSCLWGGTQQLLHSCRATPCQHGAGFGSGRDTWIWPRRQRLLPAPQITTCSCRPS